MSKPSTKRAEYECIICAFKCSDKYRYARHISTAKHQKGVQNQPCIEEQVDEIFECIACKYVCNKQSNYDRHMTTSRHLLKTVKTNSNNLFEIEPIKVEMFENEPLNVDISPQTSALYSCKCGKGYSSRSALWYHNKRCPLHTEFSEEPEKVNRVLPISQTFTDVSVHDNNMQSMMFSFMKFQSERDDKRYEAQAAQAVEAQAAQAAQAEQTRLLIEAISLNGMQCITNNNNTTNNNQFNLNVFLNEDCKNAYTLKEVAESIECTVSDLDRMDKDGYAATITRKILESIENMSITERPIHCTDARRNAVCVKEETGWEKNEMALKSLNSTIFLIGNKIHGMMDDWRAKYPEHRHGSESHRKQYHRLVMEVIKVSDRVTESQIVSRVCNGVILDRKAAMGR